MRLWCPTQPDSTAGDAEAFGWFLAGLLDGDGSVGADRRGYGFVVFTVHRSEAPLLAAVQRRLRGGRLFPVPGAVACRLRITDGAALGALLALVAQRCQHPGRRRQLRTLLAALQRPVRRRSGAALVSGAASGLFQLRHRCPPPVGRSCRRHRSGRPRRWRPSPPFFLGPRLRPTTADGWLAGLFAADGSLALN